MNGISLGTTTVEQPTATSHQSIETGHGRVSCDPVTLRLGELFVTDEGVEVEVVRLAPLTFAEAPEEDEDWGE